MSISDQIRAYIDQRGWQVTEVARLAQIDPEELCAMLHNKRRMRVDHFKAICEALRVRPEAFLGDTKALDRPV